MIGQLANKVPVKSSDQVSSLAYAYDLALSRNTGGWVGGGITCINVTISNICQHPSELLAKGVANESIA